MVHGCAMLLGVDGDFVARALLPGLRVPRIPGPCTSNRAAVFRLGCIPLGLTALSKEQLCAERGCPLGDEGLHPGPRGHCRSGEAV